MSGSKRRTARRAGAQRAVDSEAVRGAKEREAMEEQIEAALAPTVSFSILLRWLGRDEFGVRTAMTYRRLPLTSPRGTTVSKDPQEREDVFRVSGHPSQEGRSTAHLSIRLALQQAEELDATTEPGRKVPTPEEALLECAHAANNAPTEEWQQRAAGVRQRQEAAQWAGVVLMNMAAIAGDSTEMTPFAASRFALGVEPMRHDHDGLRYAIENFWQVIDLERTTATLDNEEPGELWLKPMPPPKSVKPFFEAGPVDLKTLGEVVNGRPLRPGDAPSTHYGVSDPVALQKELDEMLARPDEGADPTPYSDKSDMRTFARDGFIPRATRTATDAACSKAFFGEVVRLVSTVLPYEPPLSPKGRAEKERDEWQGKAHDLTLLAEAQSNQIDALTEQLKAHEDSKERLMTPEEQADDENAREKERHEAREEGHERGLREGRNEEQSRIVRTIQDRAGNADVPQEQAVYWIKEVSTDDCARQRDADFLFKENAYALLDHLMDGLRVHLGDKVDEENRHHYYGMMKDPDSRAYVIQRWAVNEHKAQTNTVSSHEHIDELLAAVRKLKLPTPWDEQHVTPTAYAPEVGTYMCVEAWKPEPLLRQAHRADDRTSEGYVRVTWPFTAFTPAHEAEETFHRQVLQPLITAYRVLEKMLAHHGIEKVPFSVRRYTKLGSRETVTYAFRKSPMKSRRNATYEYVGMDSSSHSGSVTSSHSFYALLQRLARDKIVAL